MCQGLTTSLSSSSSSNCKPDPTRQPQTSGGSRNGSAADVTNSNNRTSNSSSDDSFVVEKVPIERVLEPPTLMARYTCVSILIGVFAVWGKLTFQDVNEDTVPNGLDRPIHSGYIPATLTAFYLVSLPLLRKFTAKYLQDVDVKLLLRESMILYNAGQVALNSWMVYRIVDALLFRGQLFISGPIYTVDTGAAFAVYVHYCDKYLEYLDTYFMILRGKMDQVSFLHIYHHTSIALAWWIGLKLHPGGDIYFGALINSWIHVMMYSYYTLSLLKIQCPWKKYLTMAQLTQFVSVMAYSVCSIWSMPEEGTWKHYLGHCIQDFEMSSLFVLFMHFYRKAYADKKLQQQRKMKTSNDSCETSDTVAEQESISSDGSADEQSS